MFTGRELFDIIAMTIATGYIFMDFFQKESSDDPVTSWMQNSDFWERLKYSASIVAPAIILHEFGHKFVAMAYGLDATFTAAYYFLAIGVVLKLVGFPFLIIVPAYVSISGQGTAAQFALIAFAGPAVNLVLGVGAWAFMKIQNPVNRRFWYYTMYINFFLFVFNMIPIPGFDGSRVFAYLASLF